MFKAMQMGLVSGMFIGLPIASYCFFLTMPIMANMVKKVSQIRIKARKTPTKYFFLFVFVNIICQANFST